MSLFNTATWISLIRKEQSPISNDLYNVVKFSGDAKETLVKNTKGFILPCFYTNQLNLTQITQQTKVLLPNRIAKIHLIRIVTNYDSSGRLDYTTQFNIINNDILSGNQKTWFTFDEPNKMLKLNVIPEKYKYGTFALKDGITPVLSNAEYGYYDLIPLVTNTATPAYPVYDFKEINQSISYHGSTLSMLFTNVFSHISETINIPDNKSLSMMFVLTDDENHIFAISFINRDLLWRMYNTEMDLNVHICNVRNRINPFGDVYTPNTNTNAYTVQLGNAGVLAPNTAKHQIDLIHNNIVKQIDISDGDELNPLYCQTYESLRTIPTDEPDYFTRLFIDDNNYTYSNDCKTTVPHYFHTLIPPNIKELRKECKNHNGSITIPKFIYKSLCYARPDVQYLYVVGSERELTELQFNTELYLAGYRDVTSRILPDDDMYALYKANFKVLDEIDNAFPITDESVNSNQYSGNYISVKPDKQVVLNAFKIKLNELKEQLLEQGILTRYNSKGELNYFKVIGILKDDCYHLLSHYQYAVERNKDNEILSKTNKYQKLNYVCYSIALDLSKRVCNVLNNTDQTSNNFTRNNQILKVHNMQHDLNTAGVMVYDNKQNPMVANWLKVNEDKFRNLEITYSNHKANNVYNSQYQQNAIKLSTRNNSVYLWGDVKNRHKNVPTFKYLKLTDDANLQDLYGGGWQIQQKNTVVFNNSDYYSSALCLYARTDTQQFYAMGMQSLFLDNHLTKASDYGYRRNTFFNLGKTFKSRMPNNNSVEIQHDKTGSIIPNNTYYKELVSNIKLSIHSVLYMFDNSFRNTVTLGLNSYCDENTEYIQNYKMMFPFMSV